MNNLKEKNKGITLITLVIAVIILIIISSLLVYNAKTGIKLRTLKKMYNDIELLSDKVESHYAKYGALPAEFEYLGNIYFEPEPNDNDIYYVIDLNALDGVSLNYGYDFKNITSEDDTLAYNDVYIINEQSHHIYYVRGIEMDGVVYYTVDSDDKVTLSNEKVEIPEKSNNSAFSREWGVIEIEFLNGTSYGTTTTPNEPNMTSDMKAVYWENGEEKVEGESADFDKSKWYNYIAQTGATTSGGTSKWANAKTSDGSYWVWIPRYAYRIVYFDTEAHRDAYRADNTQTTGIVGYSDARGLVDKEGKTPSDIGEPVTSIGVGENKLRPHPAFETDLNQGGWDTKLEGIWVAKYEMSAETSTDGQNWTATSPSSSTLLTTNAGNTSSTKYRAVSKPGVKSWRYLYVETMYSNGFYYNRNSESHMMKNSEWGAVVYLADSRYGRNGTEVTRNTDSTYYTGGISGATALTNPLQSTTGNEYGIYDTVGGADEYVAGYIADSSRSYGNSFASTDNTTNNKTDNTKYATVYKMSTSNSYIDNYKENINKIFGDGTIETSTSGTGSHSWHSASSYFVGIVSSSSYPFFARGGYWHGTNASSFNFNYGSGDSGDDPYGFRVCLVVK